MKDKLRGHQRKKIHVLNWSDIFKSAQFTYLLIIFIGMA